MFILFSLIFMRMTGAMTMNTIFGRAHVPPMIRGMFIFALTAMIYVWTGAKLTVPEPETLLEWGLMLVRELFVGYCLGFGIEVAVMVVRFATTIMDFSMGLNMAQMYDPTQNSQSTITTNLFYTGLMLLFFTTNTHLKFFEIVFGMSDVVPYGGVAITTKLASYMLKTFNDCIVMGLEFAFPIIGIELLTEVALGILMRVIPQINIFSVNFQLKIIVGLLMLLFLFNPMCDVLMRVLQKMIEILNNIVQLLH